MHRIAACCEKLTPGRGKTKRKAQKTNYGAVDAGIDKAEIEKR